MTFPIRIARPFFFILTLSISIHAAPPRQIPVHLKSAFTCHGKIPILDRYMDESYPPSEPRVYTKERINNYLERIKLRKTSYYGNTDIFLYRALEAFSSSICGQHIGIIGSVQPWYEAIALHYKSSLVTTIEYNSLISEHPQIQTMTVDEYKKNPIKFDAILSISSIEHDGLCRFGDPINPTGDFEAMNAMKTMLKPNGVLFLAVPVGRDCLAWNAHRIYGKHRLPLLLQGWKVLASFGDTKHEKVASGALGHHNYQPVFVLAPETNGST